MIRVVAIETPGLGDRGYGVAAEPVGFAATGSATVTS